MRENHPTREKTRVAFSARKYSAPSFLSYVKTLNIGPALGIDLQPPTLQSSALPTELILP